MDRGKTKDLLKFRADPVLRRAVKLRAAYDDADLQDVIVGILTAALAEEIAEVRRRGLVAAPVEPAGPVKPLRRRGAGGS